MPDNSAVAVRVSCSYRRKVIFIGIGLDFMPQMLILVLTSAVAPE